MKTVVFFILVGLYPLSLRAAFFTGPKTVEELKRALAVIPQESHYRKRSILLSKLGNQLHAEGRWEESNNAYDEALGYGPPNVLKKRIYLYMGKNYVSLGHLDRAISAYEQAVLFDKRNWRRYRDLAELYERVNLLGNAIASYEDALRYNPREASVHFSVARVYRESKRYEQAEKNFIAAIDYGFDQNEVFGELSLVFEAQGRFAEAASAYDEPLNAKSNPEAWARLIYLALLGRQDELIIKGFNALRKNSASTPETIQFYEALKSYAEGNRKIDNKDLASLFKDIMK